LRTWLARAKVANCPKVVCLSAACWFVDCSERSQSYCHQKQAELCRLAELRFGEGWQRASADFRAAKLAIQGCYFTTATIARFIIRKAKLLPKPGQVLNCSYISARFY